LQNKTRILSSMLSVVSVPTKTVIAWKETKIRHLFESYFELVNPFRAFQ
jgi:hypothetical protein